jgi:hypothetical protein
MNDNQGNRRPPLGLLLLIPAALIVAKGASRRRAMWASAEGPSGPGGYRQGRHHRFGGAEGDPRSGFRLPPRIEAALDAWHTRAHAPADATEPPLKAETASA